MYEAKNRDYNLWRVRHIIVSLLILSAVSFNALGANGSDSNNLFNLSLEQLMDVGVYAPATITEKNPLKTPACVTVITAEDIARTPARNILDLMEIYVPGMMYLNHSMGPTPGIRGIISDRQYKFLVNVNGMNVNIKTVYGARLELLNWELSDIERIEVVRGPGSVTYGPGAIGGVINIYTKRGKQAPGFQFGGHYWGKYDSIGNWASYGYNKGEFGLYTYFSMVKTEGVDNPDIFGVGGATTSYGYLGEAGSPESGKPPGRYMTDYFDQPQIKAHIDIQINDNWRFWARYVTASSQLMQYNAVKYRVDGDYTDFRLSRFRYFQLALENNTDISNNWNLKSTFGLSSIDVIDIQKYVTTAGFPNDKDNSQNIGWIFSEWEYFARFMLNYDPKDGKLKGALGIELSYDTVRPAWGKNAEHGLRFNNLGIMSGTSSGAYGSGATQFLSTNPLYLATGNGWETLTYSLIGELNYQLTPKTTMIVSGRFDVHSYTTGMFSPRFALIYELKKDHYLKFIAQKSVRMNTQEELYFNNEKGKINKPETLETLELIYSGKMTDHLFLETSVFFNRNEVIGWDPVQKTVASLGTLKTMGVEIDLKYKKDNFDFGINHSFVKQLDWLTGDRINASGISYSDYSYSVSGITIGSNGNNLSNWASHATKLYTNIDLLEKKVTLHGDIRALWGFEGYRDGLKALSDAGGNATPIQAIKDHDVFDPIVTANASLTYHVGKSADLMVFVQNIPVFGDNKRYSYNSGYTKAYPEKTSWVEEPLVVGFKYKIRF